MKKTLTINLGGSVFHIEDDAYLRLDQYLESLRNNFVSDPQGAEIINDIEGRMAEIFLQEIGTDSKRAVTIAMVALAIETLGSPNDIADNDEPEQQSKHGNKRLFRDGSRKVFGGVCSGLANYVKIDPILMRIIFVILLLATSGGVFFVYIVLWLAVPEAVSVSQRMEMKGEKVNITNIEKKVKSDKQNDTVKQNSSEGSGVGETILKIIAWIIGGVLLVVLFIIVLALLATLFGLTVASTVLSGFIPEIFIPGQFLMNVPSEMISHTASSAIGMILFIGAPVLLILFIISKVFFKHNGKVGWVILLSMGLWIVGIVLLATSSIKLINRAADMDIAVVGDDDRGAIVIDGDTVLSFQDHAEDKFSMKIKTRKSGSLEFHESNNTVYLSKLFTAKDTLIIVANNKKPKIKEDELTWVKPTYQIVNTSEENFRMVLELRNYQLEYDNFKVKNPIFKWSSKPNKLEIREFITIDSDDSFLDESENIILEVPEGMTLIFENDADELFDNLSTEEKEVIIPGVTYEMERNELTATE